MLELHDDEARQLGALLGGAYERPKIVEELEMALGEFQIEWIKVPNGSWVNGRTLAECAFRKRTGVTVIAILRESESIAGAQPDDVIAVESDLVDAEPPVWTIRTICSAMITGASEPVSGARWTSADEAATLDLPAYVRAVLDR